MLCNLAWAFPTFVETFLGQERALRRQFREETITDLLMGGIMVAGAGRVIVEFPNEPTTGADMEWNFVNPDDSTFFRIRLQAKQATGNGRLWRRHSYRHLLHKTGSPLTLQATTLCDAARGSSIPTYPLYAFYHSIHTCQLARSSGISHVLGATLADGYLVERYVKARKKSVGTMEPHFFALSDLFCPTSILPMGPMMYLPSPRRPTMPLFMARVGGGFELGHAIPPSPAEVRERLMINRLYQADRLPGLPDKIEQLLELPPIPEVGTIPDDIGSVMERTLGQRTVETTGPLSYWRAIFISASAKTEAPEG